MTRPYVTIDGNEAVARVAYHTNEVIAIYPITPSSPMGEWCDQWAAEGRPNLWGTVPTVIQMQSEAGAAGAVHGGLQGGTLTTTFTSSQGLLLMIPNMFKIAGELTATVFHVAARTVATHALSIFGDHSDVMATRGTGFALLASGSVQEAMDFALIAQAATLQARVPFLHFFDGFRTSHEVMKIEPVTPEQMRAMIPNEVIRAHRERALSPDRPFIRGTAHNPDTYFQAREAINPYYRACPDVVQQVMDSFARYTGRSYKLFDYVGSPEADRVLVLMGSGAEAAEETVRFLAERGEVVGLIKVRLYRPFAVEYFLAALPPTVKTIAVLDRTKEPGSAGEPLYLDVLTAVAEAMARHPSPLATMPRILGGRYGLSSKEFTPAMIKGILDEMTKEHPKNHFTVGITDDVTHTSLDYDPDFSTEDPETVRAVFYGLGADGTVSANRNSIKIIGEETPHYAQGYFVYDSKKSGSVTVSHLRFGPRPIRSSYLIRRANFVACHQFSFLERFNVLEVAEPGATFLLNSPYGPDEVWDHLPRTIQQEIVTKRIRFFVIDGYRVAREAGLGGRINTILQTCFFALSDVLDQERAIAAIKRAIVRTYGKRGETVVEKNLRAVDEALDHLFEVKVPDRVTSSFDMRRPVPDEVPDFVRRVIACLIAGEGDRLPVSAFPPDGTYPSGTTRWEKRNIAPEIPVWDPDICIQCGKCVLVCPHAAIRAKVYDPAWLDQAPPSFTSAPARWREFKGQVYTLQVAPEDCTGCALCVEACPAKSKTDPSHKAITLKPQPPLRQSEGENWEFFLRLPETDRQVLNPREVKDVQLLEPLFEFSGACAGCGETPYIKLLTQLFGDRLIIANATGCSSIYGGNLPTTPYTTNREGRGPAWSNSLFEDNAEFGLGLRLALDQQAARARFLLRKLAGVIGESLVESLLENPPVTDRVVGEQRARVGMLKERLRSLDLPEARELLVVADALVPKTVWCVGGDGWAYDIGYAGVDHVLASGHNVNLLVLDTEVYSNTGGQMSKATPRGAVAKFAARGKPTAKKDLALQAVLLGNAYVARVAMGGNDTHTVKAFLEAESYPGPSLIVAYSHCIAHGYDLRYGLDQQKLAVLSGYWPLFRYDPRLREQGKNPLQLDSKPPSLPLRRYTASETRFTSLAEHHPEIADELLRLAQEDVLARWHLYEYLARMPVEELAELRVE